MTANIAIELNEEDLEEVRRRFTDPRPVLTALGLVILSKSQNAFKKQRLGRTPWPPRHVPNVAGIVSDLNRGAKPPSRRFQPRPALVDTGRLRNSLGMQVGIDAVNVGTDVKYAKDHEQGKTVTIKLTKAGKSGLKVFLKKRPELGDSLGFLFKKSTFKVKLRKRPIVEADNDDLNRMVELVERYAAGESV